MHKIGAQIIPLLHLVVATMPFPKSSSASTDDDSFSATEIDEINKLGHRFNFSGPTFRTWATSIRVQRAVYALIRHEYYCVPIDSDAPRHAYNLYVARHTNPSDVDIFLAAYRENPLVRLNAAKILKCYGAFDKERRALCVEQPASEWAHITALIFVSVIAFHLKREHADWKLRRNAWYTDDDLGPYNVHDLYWRLLKDRGDLDELDGTRWYEALTHLPHLFTAEKVRISEFKLM